MARPSFQAVVNSLGALFYRPYPVVDGKAPSLQILKDAVYRRNGDAGLLQLVPVLRKNRQGFAVEDDMALRKDQVVGWPSAIYLPYYGKPG